MAERLRALIEAHALTRDPQYLAPDAVLRDIPQDRTFEGREAIGAMQRLLFLEAFSEGEAEVRTVAVDEATGIASVEWVFRGRHTGDYLGVAATGRRVELSMLGVYEVADDLIRQARIYYDLSTLYHQLGAAPRTAPISPTAATGVGSPASTSNTHLTTSESQTSATGPIPAIRTEGQEVHQ